MSVYDSIGINSEFWSLLSTLETRVGGSRLVKRTFAQTVIKTADVGKRLYHWLIVSRL